MSATITVPPEKSLHIKLTAAVEAAALKDEQPRYECSVCSRTDLDKEDVYICAHCTVVACKVCVEGNSDLFDSCAACEVDLCEDCSSSLNCNNCGNDCCVQCECQDRCPECSSDVLLCDDCAEIYCHDCEVPLCNDHVETFGNPDEDDDSSDIKLCRECAEKRKLNKDEKKSVRYSVQSQKKKKQKTSDGVVASTAAAKQEKE